MLRSFVAHAYFINVLDFTLEKNIRFLFPEAEQQPNYFREKSW